MLILASFLLVAVIARMFLNNFRKKEAQGVVVIGQDLPVTERPELFMFRRNKAGILSFHPLAILLFICSFLVFFPFNKVIYEASRNPKAATYPSGQSLTIPTPPPIGLAPSGASIENYYQQIYEQFDNQVSTYNRAYKLLERNIPVNTNGPID